MATLRTLKFRYGQLTMQYDIQHWVLRRQEDAEPDMVSAIISLFKHCLPNMTRSEIEDALTGSNSCCLVAVRRACDVVLQQKRAAALQGKRRALIPSVVTWLPHSAHAVASSGMTLRGQRGMEQDDVASQKSAAEVETVGEESCISTASDVTWSLATGEDPSETDAASAALENTEEEEEEEGQEMLPDIELAALERSITVNDLEGVTFRQKLLAAAAWEHLSNPLGLRLMQLTLIGARLKYQGFALAHHLLHTLKDPDVMGALDAIVVWAGLDARDWFVRQGFTDDRILNSRYERFLQSWEDSLLMSYCMPAEVSPQDEGDPQQAGAQDSAQCLNAARAEGYLKLEQLDATIAQWRAKRLDEYAVQLHLINGMREEIAYLRDKVQRQDRVVEYLTQECGRHRRNNQRLEAETKRLQSLLRVPLAGQRRVEKDAGELGFREEVCEQDMMSGCGEPGHDATVEAQVLALAFAAADCHPSLTHRLTPASSQEGSQEDSLHQVVKPQGFRADTCSEESGVADTYNHKAFVAAAGPSAASICGLAGTRVHEGSTEFAQVRAEVANSVRQGHGVEALEVRWLVRLASDCQMQAFRARLAANSLDGYPVTTMMCGGPHVLMSALVAGSLLQGSERMAPGPGGNRGGQLAPYGKGIYLTRYASKAARFCGSREMLVVKVALGNTETQTVEDSSRVCPSPGFHSIVVPGRRISANHGNKVPWGGIFAASAPVAPDADTLRGGEKESRQHQEEFVVFDPAQILPMYAIGFDIHTTCGLKHETACPAAPG